MTQALDEQIRRAVDDTSLAVRDIPADLLVAVFVRVMELRGDMTGDMLEQYGNEVGRLGHERNKLTVATC